MTDSQSLMVQQEHYLDYHFKSHNLIYASTDLTSRMMDIFALMLTEMKEEDWYSDLGEDVVPEYVFSSHQLCDWFGVESKQLYSVLKKSAQGLAQREIGLEEQGRFRYRPILSDIQYDKGTLTISPNAKLRRVYIVNAGSNGYAKIDNRLFKELSNPNAKRVFEFLSRYRTDKEMYHITVNKLQILFGVKRDNGAILKPSYARQSAFVDKVIKPALMEIARCPEAKEKLEVVEKNGKVGYEMIAMGNNEYKIKFLVRWKNQVTKVQLIQASRKVVHLLENLKKAKAMKTNTLPILKELGPLLQLLGRDTQTQQVEAQIAKINKERAVQEQLKVKESVENELAKVDLLWSSDLFDSQ